MSEVVNIGTSSWSELTKRQITLTLSSLRELPCWYQVDLSWSELTRDSHHCSTSIKREIPYLKGMGASKATRASITPHTDITPTPNPTMS